MSDTERTKEIKFFTDPPAALNTTVDQALRDHLEDYLPGGEKFKQATSDRIVRSQREEPPTSGSQE